eukprot:jgi/Chlat1/7638/Chrsp64S07112
MTKTPLSPLLLLVLSLVLLVRLASAASDGIDSGGVGVAVRSQNGWLRALTSVVFEGSDDDEGEEYSGVVYANGTDLGPSRVLPPLYHHKRKRGGGGAGSNVTLRVCRARSHPGYATSCAYVSEAPECVSRQNFVNYYALYYCGAEAGWPRPLLLLSFIFAACVLFYVLAASADRFFCPALENIASWLRMPQDLAGATLLAIGNGGPDLFSQIAALVQTPVIQLDLAVASTLGQNLVICCVVFWVVAVFSPARPVTIKPRPYLRDVLVRSHRREEARQQQQLIKSGEPSPGASHHGHWLADHTLNLPLLMPSQSHSPSHSYASSRKCEDSSYECDAGDDDVLELFEKRHAWREGARRWGRRAGRVWERCTQWSRKALWERLALPITLPVHAVMSVTAPEVAEGEYSSLPFVMAMPVCGPLFFVLTQEVDLHADAYVYGAAVGLFFSAVIYKTYPRDGRPPSYAMVLTLAAFIQSMVWMDLVATELIALFQVTGSVAKLSQEFLGVTLLSWGNALGDVIADIAVMRHGGYTMVMAAVFAGPMFNLMGSLGTALIMVTAKHPLTVAVSGPMMLLFAFHFLGLLLAVVAMPFFTRWTVTRKLGITMFALYGVFTVLYLLTNQSSIFQNLLHP